MRVDCWFAVLAHDIVSHIQMQIRNFKEQIFWMDKNFYRWSKANAKAHKWNIVKSMTPNISMTWIGNIKHSYTDIDMLLHTHTHKITKNVVSPFMLLWFFCILMYWSVVLMRQPNTRGKFLCQESGNKKCWQLNIKN